MAASLFEGKPEFNSPVARLLQDDDEEVRRGIVVLLGDIGDLGVVIFSSGQVFTSPDDMGDLGVEILRSGQAFTSMYMFEWSCKEGCFMSYEWPPSSSVPFRYIPHGFTPSGDLGHIPAVAPFRICT